MRFLVSSQLNFQRRVRALPKSGCFLQDTSHDVHLTAAVAEASQEIELLQEEVAVQLNENLIHHEWSHYAQWTKLLLCEQPGVHPLQKVHKKHSQKAKHTFFLSFLFGTCFSLSSSLFSLYKWVNGAVWQHGVALLTIRCTILSTSSSCLVLDSRRKWRGSWIISILTVSIISLGNFLMVLTLREATHAKRHRERTV